MKEETAGSEGQKASANECLTPENSGSLLPAQRSKAEPSVEEWQRRIAKSDPVLDALIKKQRRLKRRWLNVNE